MRVKTLLTVLLCLAVLLGLAACSDKLEYISVMSEPVKTEYYVGETLDLTGGQIEAVYESGKTRTVQMTNRLVNVEGFDSNEPGEQILTVTYLRQTCNFTVTVRPETIEVVDIEVGKLPTKVNYFTSDEEIDLTGGILNLIYNYGPDTTIPMTDEGVTVMPYDLSVAGPVEIVLEYMDFETSFMVTVKVPSVESIEIITLPTKLEYNLNEEIDLEGGAIRAHYDNGTYVDIPMTLINVGVEYDFSVEGEVEVTVAYEGCTAKFTVNVTAYEPDWEYIFYILDEGEWGILFSQIFGEDLNFLYFWFAAEYEYNHIMASGNAEWIAYWEENFAEMYEGISIYAIEWFYSYSTALFDDPLLNQFVRAAATMAYNYFYFEEYVATDPEFQEHCVIMMNLYAQLDVEQKGEFFGWIYDAFTKYANFTAMYYEVTIGAEIAEVYFNYIQASILYGFHLYSGEESYFTQFMKVMRSAVKLYDELVNPAYFDELFPEFAELRIIFEENYIPMPEVLDQIAEWMEIGYDEWNNFNDTYYFYYYYMILEAIEGIYESGDAELIEDYETMLMADFEEWEATTYGWYSENLHYIFDYPEFKEFLLNYCYTVIVWIENEEYWGTEEFIEKVQDVMALYAELDLESRVMFIYGGFFGDVDSYEGYLFLTADYYYIYMELPAAQTYVYLCEASFWYDYYLYTGDAEIFIEVMANYVIPGYEGLSGIDKADFDAMLLDMYNMYLDLFDQMSGSDFILQQIAMWMETAFNEWDMYNDTAYFYYYYKILEAIDDIYESGDPELIAAYEQELMATFLAWESETYSWYINISEVFADPMFKQFMLYYGYTATNYIEDEDYILTGEFNTNIEILIDMYNNFDSEMIYIFIFETFVDYDAYDVYLYMTAEYYFSFMELPAVQTYVYLLEASYWYAYYEIIGDEETFLEVMTNYTIPAYDGLSGNDKTDFDTYFGDWYNDLLAIYLVINVPAPSGYDWSLLKYYFERLDAHKQRQDTLWLYFYYELEVEVAYIYSEGNIEWEEYFEAKYGSKYDAALSFFDSWFYSYAPVLFDDVQVNEFVRKLAYLAHAWEYLMVSNFDPEYSEDAVELLDMYYDLLPDHKDPLMLGLGDFVSYFCNITAWYYNQFMSVDAINVWFVLIQAHINYDAWLSTEKQARFDRFIATMEIAIERYVVLPDQAAFDAELKDLYDEMKGIYYIYNTPGPEGYDWDYVKTIAQGMEANGQGSDDLCYLYYYYEMMNIVDELNALGNEDFNEYFNNNYGAFVADEMNFYDGWFASYSPVLFDSETGLAYVKHIAIMTYLYINDFDADFYDLMVQHDLLYAELDGFQKNGLLASINSYVYYLCNSYAGYYYFFAGFTVDEINILFVLLQADMNYYAWEATGNTTRYNRFLELMVLAVERYNALPSTSNFDAEFGDLYEFWTGIYFDLEIPGSIGYVVKKEQF